VLAATKAAASTDGICAGGQHNSPPAQMCQSLLAGPSQVGHDGFMLTGSNYARQHGK